MKSAIFFAIGCAAVSIASMGYAQDEQTGFSLGLGAGFSTNPYEGEDTSFSAVPLIRYKGDGFSLGADGATVTAYSLDALRFELLARPRFTALRDPDADELDGIDREVTLDAGGKLSYSLTDRSNLSATLLQEITGEHDGQEFLLELSNRTNFGPVPLIFGTGLSWKSEELSSYMFGVTSGEARSDRPEYDLDSTLTPYFSVSSGFPLSDTSRVIASVKAEFLGDEITDSPIVEDDQIFSGLVGLSFSF
ncbi:MipA/OmpV family protein [Parasulfitobacter algicola]|uniref:MipA/OmpV family protein n=1 Tax=Parasulfitobacter algicola TaxID=2614809 RepID=A0ABX2IXD9_9RHOB|nr:MipA/OmpV family protein [Sulfitobacter algicola]NSX55870.1 MipA/OmpV family protein [Sulfitobacter algicola]